MLKQPLSTLLLLLMITATAHAEDTDVCELTGYAFNTYIKDKWPSGQETHACWSSYKELTGSPMANNIAIYAYGTSQEATRFKIVLNVNDLKKEQSALESLANDTYRYILKIGIDSSVLSKLVDSIKLGKNVDLSASGVTYSFKVDYEWNTGKEYHVIVSR
ncbi:hypothetical protein G3R49_13765 [Shewanella sp. WXL01]|uniref:hypothetical protein n=1 Tax=Shewanella sp. WXL01 TaxID=2709721 RepID=UPI001438360D|nr:hypothetical protein [Shewanella sp. WXL01]NKF51627.1 hypothetical protein [Shewanella sp. WXL01]